WALDEGLRRLVWRDRVGYRPYRRASEPFPRAAVIDPPGARELAPRPSPAGQRAGFIGAAPPGPNEHAFALAAQFYGLEVEQAAPDGGPNLIAQAADERWPLLGVSLDSPGALAEHLIQPLAAFVKKGGAVLLGGLLPSSDASLTAFG